MDIDREKQHVFENIYSENAWGDRDSKSGPGSNLQQTVVLRKVLPDILLKYGLRSILDVPCGDFHWMAMIREELDAVLDMYVGGDIVSEMVERNNKAYGSKKFIFRAIDLTASRLPRVDIVFCRDCLVHLSYKDIYDSLRNIKKAGATFLLTTSFTNAGRKNRNILTGDWRPLNLRKFPFRFPKPLETVVEHCSENNGIYSDKSLLLWRVDSISLFTLGCYIFLAKVKGILKVA